jgi:hypothetical protein
MKSACRNPFVALAMCVGLAAMIPVAALTVLWMWANGLPKKDPSNCSE